MKSTLIQLPIIESCPKCEVELKNDVCPDCGVYFGDPCEECGHTGYHAEECPEIEKN